MTYLCQPKNRHATSVTYDALDIIGVDSSMATSSPRTDTEEQERSGVEVLSVRQLMWIRFKRNRPALISAVFLAIRYFVAIFAPFFAPYGVRSTHDRYPGCPPNFVLHEQKTFDFVESCRCTSRPILTSYFITRAFFC